MAGEGEKILVVDDDFDVRRLLRRSLERAGFMAREAVDGCDAIEMLRRESFDLIFLDLKMPHMDGVNTLKMLNALDPRVEVVILTGHASLNTAISTLREGGAYDYLTKPLGDMDELVKIARKALERRRLALEVIEYQREIKSFKRRLKEETEKRTKPLRRKMEALENLVENKTAFFKRMSTELKDRVAHMEKALNSQGPTVIQAQLNQFKGTLTFLDYFYQLAVGERVRPDFEERVAISHIVEMISRQASGLKEGRVSVSRFDGGGYIRGDVDMLTWAIWHLIGNGLRFGKPGGNGISLSFSHESGRLDIAVADGGVGISGREVKEIFKLFHRGRKYPQVNGKGVGLAIVKSIVEEHGGTIRVESKAGKGSTFIISLPLL
ncbi:MAG: response regulator [Thermodesulfobacteriota bacterium]